MNPQDTPQGTPQQQAIERLRTAVNVLVTVSNSPSVDQLSAAIGFTLMLNKLGKHATAVFSGEVPSTIEFLKPESTIEKNTDSLRDFIVSLDKSKADKLRYKVEENVVKIFITPYRTSLSEKDLNFSQGDFNVDAVVALGVTEREQLDQAIISHGRILHDATVITMTAGTAVTTLGAINWQDASASSLCEMLVSVSEALQAGSMDNQIATAYLTGIVAQTERFRNEKTTPKIMSMSAQLMAAGANQQLIASSLEQVVEVPITAAPVTANNDATPEVQDKSVETAPDGSLTIEHQENTKPETTEEPKIDMLPAPVNQPVAEPEIELPEEPETPEHGQIAIDEHGNMSPATLEDKTLSSTRRIIQPLPPMEAGDSNETSATGPHPFTANMTADGEDEPSTDPLSATTDTENNKILEHNNNSQATPVPQASDVLTPAMGDLPANEMTFPPALDDSTIRDLEKTFDSPHIAQDPSSTLDEIEVAVDSPHVSHGAGVESLDTARDAVQSAIQSTPYDPSRPDPVQALNATHFDLPLGVAPSADPVLAGLGLTDTVDATSQFILPPAPIVQTQQPQQVEETSSEAPPPVPPPLLPLQ